MKVLEIIGHSSENIQRDFGHILAALRFGARRMVESPGD